jgi:hypothetical protein
LGTVEERMVTKTPFEIWKLNPSFSFYGVVRLSTELSRLWEWSCRKQWCIALHSCSQSYK